MTGEMWIHRWLGRWSLARERPEWSFDSEAGLTVRAQSRRGGASRVLRRQLVCRNFVCSRCNWASKGTGRRAAEAKNVDIGDSSLGVAARDDELHQRRWRVDTAARYVVCGENGAAFMPLPNHVFAYDSSEAFGPLCSKLHLPLKPAMSMNGGVVQLG
jgi:hypothetical protein